MCLYKHNGLEKFLRLSLFLNSNGHSLFATWSIRILHEGTRSCALYVLPWKNLKKRRECLFSPLPSCKAMIMAYNLRQPAYGLVLHSDRGSHTAVSIIVSYWMIKVYARAWGMLEPAGIMPWLNAFLEASSMTGYLKWLDQNSYFCSNSFILDNIWLPSQNTPNGRLYSKT